MGAAMQYRELTPPLSGMGRPIATVRYGTQQSKVEQNARETEKPICPLRRQEGPLAGMRTQLHN